MTVSTLPSAPVNSPFYPTNPVQSFFESLVPAREPKTLKDQRAEISEVVDLSHVPALKDEWVPSIHALVNDAYMPTMPFTDGKSSPATSPLANPRKVALTNAHVVGGLTTFLLSAISGDPLCSLAVGTAAGTVVAPISYLNQDMTNKNVLTEIAQAKPGESQSGMPNLHDIGRAPSALEFVKNTLDTVGGYSQKLWNTAEDTIGGLTSRFIGKGVDKASEEHGKKILGPRDK